MTTTPNLTKKYNDANECFGKEYSKDDVTCAGAFGEPACALAQKCAALKQRFHDRGVTTISEQQFEELFASMDTETVVSDALIEASEATMTPPAPANISDFTKTSNHEGSETLDRESAAEMLKPLAEAYWEEKNPDGTSVVVAIPGPYRIRLMAGSQQLLVLQTKGIKLPVVTTDTVMLDRLGLRDGEWETKSEGVSIPYTLGKQRVLEIIDRFFNTVSNSGKPLQATTEDTTEDTPTTPIEDMKPVAPPVASVEAPAPAPVPRPTPVTPQASPPALGDAPMSVDFTDDPFSPTPPKAKCGSTPDSGTFGIPVKNKNAFRFERVDGVYRIFVASRDLAEIETMVNGLITLGRKMNWQ